MKFSLSGISTVPKLIVELISGLTRLTFRDNFLSFEEEAEISNGGTHTFSNRFTRSIPSGYIIISQIGGGLVGKDTLQPWSLGSLPLKNFGPQAVKVKVIFFR